ncbi:ABC transporter permease [Aureibaculum sp. A20]|uniref:ABC transporter permease n=1 Tax=Aureibaculum flavum TaxID=2795986 RepID=A0ABS0WMB4_9FLAO|nr:FtsX-like permease family protein [Aureibaculum flavum]MBJ2173105.1 ABC transporter permease [Aureibaculum flavum]
MFKNYLKIAWRGIKKDKLFASIKIGGFAVGIAACLLISLFIIDEQSYDKYYKSEDQIFRVLVEFPNDGELLKSVHFQLPFAEQLQSDYPEIELAGKYNAGELFGAGKKTIQLHGESQNYNDDGFIFASQGLLEVLEIAFTQGVVKGALTNPNSLVISNEKALKYFPNGNAVGQTIILDGNTKNPYKITGVMAKRSFKSHFHYDFLMTIDDDQMNWINNNYLTYVKTSKNADITALENKMYSIITNHMIPALKKRGYNTHLETLQKAKFILQPVADIHLKTDSELFDHLSHGDIRFVWLFAAIAGFILLLACINFINLSTAKSANRAKEVGLRKTVGAFRNSLVSQFLSESILFSLISFVIGVFLAWLLLPIFNSIALKTIEMPWNTWWFIPTILTSALLVGLIAGLYPAFYLSSFKPALVLKGNMNIGGKSVRLRSSLVVFQFATSVILIIGTLVIYKQMDFVLTKELGYEKEQVLVIEGTSVLDSKAENFKEQLLQLPSVKLVTKSNYLPIEGTKRNGNTFRKSGVGNEQQGVPSQIWRVDYDYIKTLGIKLIEGRDFSKKFASDSINSIIINKKMASALGLDTPLGKQISNGSNWTIVGVVDDFHYRSLKDDIEPLALVIGNDIGAFSVKLDSENITEVLSSISSVWTKNVPNQAFNYSFLDQKFAQMHEDVKRMGKIFNSFALFAIFVACLGLFGLSAFMIEQRKKEISIRLVLGAPFKSIYKLLTLDFLKLIFIAILIAIPIGWYMMNKWLEDFVYKIDIGWELFLGAGIIALLIAILTISYQSIGAALIKPLKSLRKE